jgi:hypothetical protein
MVPPDLGWQSLSVDASFIEDTNSASWGVGIRDYLGQINLSDWGLIPICDGAESSYAVKNVRCQRLETFAPLDLNLMSRMLRPFAENQIVNRRKELISAEITYSYN